MKLSSVRQQDIAKLNHALRATPRQANQVLAVLSKAFNLAEVWGLRPEHSNPVRLVKTWCDLLSVMRACGMLQRLKIYKANFCRDTLAKGYQDYRHSRLQLAPNSLIAKHSSLRHQKIFNIALAYGERMIDLNRLANDTAWETIAFETRKSVKIEHSYQLPEAARSNKLAVPGMNLKNKLRHSSSSPLT
ncbi:hypothetical protein [Pseudovibrio sp. Alg231-02]|uniref:hypothetical protein n=1 Tax=Pseudovibrio sp. Alg231-02 TaxID=1922223 RepID=UPI001AD92CC5|nr:hypothetical protein [Pseudovibrio sp. Alg231-02]